MIKRKRFDGYAIRSPSPNEKFYCLKDAEQIQNLLIKYQESLITDSVSDCILYWSHLVDSYDKRPKNIKKHGHELDIVLDALFDIFPPPYHL